MESRHKIFADFNNADSEGRIRLDTFGSIRDIENLKIEMKPGLEVLLDDNDSLQAFGVVQFSDKENMWVAVINWDNIIHTDVL